MTRDFIFDAAGNVIGYRCRCDFKNECIAKDDHVPCNRMFATPRGLWQHQRRTHGPNEQESFQTGAREVKYGDKDAWFRLHLPNGTYYECWDGELLQVCLLLPNVLKFQAQQIRITIEVEK